MSREWSPGSWRSRPISQQPHYDDQVALRRVEARLRGLPPLVLHEEVLRLRAHLGRASQGQAFLLQGGPCAETFEDFGADFIRGTYDALMKMALLLSVATTRPVVRVGRLAGQFAKPRSSSTEERGGVVLGSYRGDMVNDARFEEEARRPDPQRQLTAYYHAASTLNLLRAFAREGYAAARRPECWSTASLGWRRSGRSYRALLDRIGEALALADACGMESRGGGDGPEGDFFTSHEALLLPYEQSLTRQDPVTGRWYCASAHKLWIGDRTRRPDGAHVEFARGLDNPIGVKAGPSMTVDDLLRLVEVLDPEGTPGRLTVVTRMGARAVAEKLPPLVRAAERAGHRLVWACDPMHGNTFTAATGHKTRRFEDILREIQTFLGILAAEGVPPGGIHVEMVGDDVTECLGGEARVTAEHLRLRYETKCDPRLNGSQSIELAFRLIDALRGCSAEPARGVRAAQRRRVAGRPELVVEGPPEELLT